MSGGSSVYSPLPQSNSDSDEFSEEELHSSTERQSIIGRKSKLSNQTRPEIILNVKKTKVTSYKQLDSDRDVGTALNGFQFETDEITVIEPQVKIESFSPTRKICFAFSLFLCVFTTVVFLWILPCEIGSCPASPSSGPDIYWKTVELFYLELHGPINIVPNSWDKNQNLIFLFRNSFSRVSEETQFPPEGGGIISLLGSNGEISWWIVLKREPKKMGCHLIDVNLDGINDCIVAGRNNLLKAVQPLLGTTLWDIHNNSYADPKQCDIDFPMAVNDVDGDGVNDLLTTCSSALPRDKERRNSSPRTFFLLVSGKNGTVIGKPVEIPGCSSIRNFTLDEELTVSYECSDAGGKGSIEDRIDLRRAIESVLLRKLYLKRGGQPRRSHSAIDSEERTFAGDGASLGLDNLGRCPENCRMIVTVRDERSGKNHTIKSLDNAYGMIPVKLNFGRVNGFAFKYWEWRRDEAEPWREARKEKSKQTLRRLEESSRLERDVFGEQWKETKRIKRTSKRLMDGRMPLRASDFEGANFKFHHITERIVFITLNETDSRVVNASHVEITQICKDFDCQPDAVFQKHSLLITRRDDCQSLVSYSSSFARRVENVSTGSDVSWRLVSTVQVIRLEDKLFDSKT